MLKTIYRDPETWLNLSNYYLEHKKLGETELGFKLKNQQLSGRSGTNYKILNYGLSNVLEDVRKVKSDIKVGKLDSLYNLLSNLEIDLHLPPDPHICPELKTLVGDAFWDFLIDGAKALAIYALIIEELDSLKDFLY